MYRLVRGVYGQRQPDVQMMRIKIPGGALTPEHLEAFGDVVSQYAPLKKGHITPARICRSTSSNSPTPPTSCASSATPASSPARRAATPSATSRATRSLA